MCASYNTVRSDTAVNDQTSILLSTLVGAIVGGCAGYLFLTEDGRRLREDLEPRILDLVAEIGKAGSVVKDAKHALADVRPFGR